MAFVVVRRLPSGGRDSLRRYKVLIDDREASLLRRWDSGRYEVAPGHHVLAVGIDWKRPLVPHEGRVRRPRAQRIPGGSGERVAVASKRKLRSESDTPDAASALE